MTTSRRGIRACIVFAAVLALSFTTTFAGNPPPLAFEWQHFTNGVYLRGTPWSPDNRYLAVSSLEGDALLLLDRETWEVDRQLELPTNEASLLTVQWSPNGNYIAVVDGFELVVFDIHDKSRLDLPQLLSIEMGSRREMRWLGATNILAMLDHNGMITLIDVAVPEVIREIELDHYESGFHYTVFDWSQEYGLFAAPFDITNTVGFWDEFGNLPNGLVRESAPNENRFASQCGSMSADPSPTPEFNFLGMGGNVNLLDLEWSTDGARLAFTIDASVIVCTLNLQGTAVTSLRQLHIPDPSYDPSNMNTHKYSMPDGVIWSPDDYWLLASLFYVPPGMIQNSCGIAVFDVANDFAYRGKIGEEFCHVWGMSWSPDGRQLALGNGTDGYWVGTLQSE